MSDILAALVFLAERLSQIRSESSKQLERFLGKGLQPRRDARSLFTAASTESSSSLKWLERDLKRSLPPPGPIYENLPRSVSPKL